MKNEYLVYVLECRDGSLYTGMTNDLRKRLKKHSTGKASKYTRSRLPVRCVWSQIQPTESRARKREIEIKKLKKEDKLSIIKGKGRHNR